MITLIGEKNLQARICDMACEIDEYYLDKEWYRKTQEPVIVIGVLSGAFFFMADLVRQLSIRVELDFIKVSTYPGKSTIAKNSKIITPLNRSLHNANILLLDDILDSGKTIKLLLQHLGDQCPESITTAVLLRKKGKATDDVTAKFVGFDIPDEFVVGYGLDYNGQYREMPYVAIWSEDEFRTSKSKISQCQRRHSRQAS